MVGFAIRTDALILMILMSPHLYSTQVSPELTIFVLSIVYKRTVFITIQSCLAFKQIYWRPVSPYSGFVYTIIFNSQLKLLFFFPIDHMNQKFQTKNRENYFLILYVFRLRIWKICQIFNRIGKTEIENWKR